MIEFPRSRTENLALAKELVVYLRKKRKNTNTASEWTEKNIGWLADFFRTRELACFHTGSGEGSEFLWDFTAYAKNYGMLIVAESEHSKSNYALEYDFEKLFYARSPIKLFMCRVGSEKDAEERSNSLFKFMDGTCKAFGPGEIFILYFVWWAESGGTNRDIAYYLQVDGELSYAGIEGRSFQHLSE